MLSHDEQCFHGVNSVFEVSHATPANITARDEILAVSHATSANTTAHAECHVGQHYGTWWNSPDFTYYVSLQHITKLSLFLPSKSREIMVPRQHVLRQAPISHGFSLQTHISWCHVSTSLGKLWISRFHSSVLWHIMVPGQHARHQVLYQHHPRQISLFLLSCDGKSRNFLLVLKQLHLATSLAVSPLDAMTNHQIGPNKPKTWVGGFALGSPSGATYISSIRSYTHGPTLFKQGWSPMSQGGNEEWGKRK